MNRTDLLAQLDALLTPGRYTDYCPNGLQVEGRPEIARIVCGVSASQALIDAAVAQDADAILVHHGWFWKGEDPRVVGMKQRRLATLLAHGINLVAYHLPLDAHPELGNNAQLARILGLDVAGTLDSGPGKPGLLWHGTLPHALPPEQLTGHIAARLGRTPLWVGPPTDTPIRRIAWCTGAAQSYLADAVAAGVDAFLSGEISEQTTHIARECGVHYYACGHHATERYGVAALGAHLAAQFGLDVRMVDLDNPV